MSKTLALPNHIVHFLMKVSWGETHFNYSFVNDISLSRNLEVPIFISTLYIMGRIYFMYLFAGPLRYWLMIEKDHTCFCNTVHQ